MSKRNETNETNTPVPADTSGRTGNLYRVNYTYVSPEGILRQGAIVVEEPNVEAAKQAALARIPAKQRHPKVTTITAY